MTDAKYDVDYYEGLALYVRTYSYARAEAGQPMTIEEIIGGLVSVMVMAIEQCPPDNYRRRLVAATHAALDDRLAQPFTPTSKSVN